MKHVIRSPIPVPASVADLADRTNSNEAGDRIVGAGRGDVEFALKEGGIEDRLTERKVDRSPYDGLGGPDADVPRVANGPDP